jgi:Putative transmembrane protein (PGPGW)
VKNLIGGVFVLAGIVMLVLPGQGVLTIMLGIALMNFPGKFQLERWIVSRGPTLWFINRLRRRRGRPALVLEGERKPAGTESA